MSLRRRSDLRIQVVLIQQLQSNLAGLAAEGHGVMSGSGLQKPGFSKKPGFFCCYGNFFNKLAISKAASAHSTPLLPTLPPER